MLNENIKAIRKSKGMTQEDLGIRLNVVRQTISKWEKGLSVPDSDMLISLSEVLETPVSTLLGETISQPMPNDLKIISEKLEVINLKLSKRKEARRKILHFSFIFLTVLLIVVFMVLFGIKSPYLNWTFNNPETSFLRLGLHVLEWIFVRIAPIILLGLIIGIILTRNKRKNL